MLLRRALFPIAVVLALGLVSTDLAQAAPLGAPAPSSAIAFGGIHVGVGVAVPLGPVHRRGHRGRRMHGQGYAQGRWVMQSEEVWVPGEVIGYDRHGHPIVTEGFWAVERRRVWVPVRRRVVHHAPRGRVAVGWRFH